jgi:hypothetical protein
MSGRLGMNKCRLTSLMRLSYLAPVIVRALLEGRQPIELTPTRLLRLSKDLPHIGANNDTLSASPPKPPSKPRRNAPHPTTRKRPRETLRPFAPRTRTFCVSGCRRCVRRSANARKFQDYSGDRGNQKYEATAGGFVAGGPGFEPRLTESESAVRIDELLPWNWRPSISLARSHSASNSRIYGRPSRPGLIAHMVDHIINRARNKSPGRSGSRRGDDFTPRLHGRRPEPAFAG